MHYITSAIFILYLFLPTFVSNGAPIIVKNIGVFKKFTQPISEKYLGKNKTYRGFLAGILSGVLVSILQFYLTDFTFIESVKMEYFEVIPSLDIAIYAGFLQGFGALFGDAVKSFFKRQLQIKPGDPWPIFDGVDYIFGSAILLSPIFFPSILGVIFLCFVGPIASLLANIGAYVINWKEVRY